jgi:hypothetical protein
MAVGFLAPTHVPIRLVSDCRACFASASIASSFHSSPNAPTGIAVKVGPQRDPSEPAVIAHWGADPID